MKKCFYIYFILLIILLLIIYIFTIRKNSNEEVIKINSNEYIYINPDYAKINIGIYNDSTDIVNSQKIVNKSIEKIITFLHEQGITNDDIQNSDFNISQIDNYNDNNNEKEFRVENTLNIKVTNLELIGKIIDYSVNSGANRVYNISYYCNDYDNYYKQALEKAILKAKEKASEMLKPLNYKLGNLKSLKEINDYPSYYQKSYYENTYQSNNVETTIITNKIKIDASVEIEFYIKK